MFCGQIHRNNESPYKCPLDPLWHGVVTAWQSALVLEKEHDRLSPVLAGIGCGIVRDVNLRVKVHFDVRFMGIVEDANKLPSTYQSTMGVGKILGCDLAQYETFNDLFLLELIGGLIGWNGIKGNDIGVMFGWR
jgi:hypothetical protein